MVETSPLEIVIAGATGRYGRFLHEAAKGDPGIRVVGLVSSKNPLLDVVRPGAVVIDFTVPAAVAELAEVAAAHGMPMVIATTGLTTTEMAAIREASRRVPIVQTPNTSVAITLMARWLREAAAMLGPGYRAAIEETHHADKKDAPSGTALRLRRALCEGSGAGEDAVPIAAHREGEVIGTHAVTLHGPCDTLTITHAATDRRLFCDGALTAARWVARQRPGLYTMEDVLKGHGV